MSSRIWFWTSMTLYGVAFVAVLVSNEIGVGHQWPLFAILPPLLAAIITGWGACCKAVRENPRRPL